MAMLEVIIPPSAAPRGEANPDKSGTAHGSASVRSHRSFGYDFLADPRDTQLPEPEAGRPGWLGRPCQLRACCRARSWRRRRRRPGGAHLPPGVWAWVCCRETAPTAAAVCALVAGRAGASRPARAPATARAAQLPSAGPYPALKACAEAYDPWPANTATASATPNAPPSWRSMVKVPDALPMCCGATWLSTELCAAGSAAENPRPVRISGTVSCQ